MREAGEIFQRSESAFQMTTTSNDQDLLRFVEVKNDDNSHNNDCTFALPDQAFTAVLHPAHPIADAQFSASAITSAQWATPTSRPASGGSLRLAVLRFSAAAHTLASLPRLWRSSTTREYEPPSRKQTRPNTDTVVGIGRRTRFETRTSRPSPRRRTRRCVTHPDRSS